MKVEGSNKGYIIPNPIALISAYDGEGKPNAFPVCWIMNVGHNPPKIAFITREFRYTYSLFRDSGYFGINIPKAENAKEVDFFGRNSGKDVNKFEKTSFTTFEGTKAKIPLITECQMNFECKLIDKKVIEDTMILLIAEVLSTHFDEEIIDEKGKIDESKLDMLTLGYSHYWTANKLAGDVGMSKEMQ
ncbi:MAG: flavin reductase family protein [Candidatus Thorarchaeota archaeon]